MDGCVDVCAQAMSEYAENLRDLNLTGCFQVVSQTQHTQ